jgi:hypothetical protein
MSIDRLKTPSKEEQRADAEGGVVEGVMVRPAWYLNWPYKAQPVVALSPRLTLR